jgi:hypothetical protein
VLDRGAVELVRPRIGRDRDAPQNRRESYRANHFKQDVFTRPGPQADS